MKVAVPVMDDSLKIARNAGHTPYFAIFEIGGGMFKTVKFKELRENPKMQDEEVDEADHVGRHVCDAEDDVEHVKAHYTMAEAIEDCDYLVVKMACKNTANAMKSSDVKIKKYNGNELYAPQVLGAISNEL
jgi:predicted Fe-Mo cluster-binding NifX family protein